MVTIPAWGTLAAPMDAAVAVILQSKIQTDNKLRSNLDTKRLSFIELSHQ